MLITKTVTINHKNYKKNYSDADMMIRRNDGKLFDVAIDPLNTDRTYTETDIPIQPEPEEEE